MYTHTHTHTHVLKTETRKATNHQLSELNEDITTPGRSVPSPAPPRPALCGWTFTHGDRRALTNASTQANGDWRNLPQIRLHRFDAQTHNHEARKSSWQLWTDETLLLLRVPFNGGAFPKVERQIIVTYYLYKLEPHN